MIAPSHSRKPVRPTLVFTDRDELREIFRKAVADPQAADKYRILNWHGIGGQGKTALCQEFQRIMTATGAAAVNLPGKREFVWGVVDFDKTDLRRPESALLTLRLLLGREGRLRFPAFDAAFTIYTVKSNPGVDIRRKHSELFRSDSEGIADLIELTEGVLGLAAEAASAIVPGANVIYKWGARLTGRLREWWDRRGKSVLAGIDQLLPDELLDRLPTFLGIDLCDALAANPKLRPVILLDTYEALWRERAKKHALSDRRTDLWVRTLVEYSPGTLFVILGRDELRWPDIDSDWGDVVETRPLGELSDQDADRCLVQVPVEEPQIRARIIQGARGIPYYLELQVILYAGLKNRGVDPSPEAFGGSHDDILNRFLDHVGESEEGALRLASYLDIVTPDSMNDLMASFPGRATNFRWSLLVSRGFFQAAEGGGQLLHALMREELQRREKREEPEQFERIHRHLFEIWEAQITPLSGVQLGTSHEEAFERAWRHLSVIAPKDSVRWALEQSQPFDRARRAGFLERLYSWSFAVAIEELGQAHPFTLATRHELAQQIGRQGRYAEAEEEFRAIYEVQRRPDFLGEAHPFTLTTRANLVHQIGNQGRYAEAEKEFRAIYEILRRPDVLGQAHPSTLATRHELAQQIGNQGRYAEAEEEFRAIYEVERRPDVLGEAHPSTLVTRHDLAQQIGRQGRHAEAEAEFRAIYEVFRQPDVLGEAHPYTLTTRDSLAQQIGNQGRHAEAEAEFRAIYEIRRRPDVLGEAHPNALRTRFHLAKCLDDLGRRPEATRLLSGLEAEFLKNLPADHKWVREVQEYIRRRDEGRG